MRWGIFGDTHNCDDQCIRDVIGEFRQRKVDVIAHTGDIEIQHVNRELFGGYDVLCALTQTQALDEKFCMAPQGWRFIEPAYREEIPEINEALFDPIGLGEFRKLSQFCKRARIFPRLVNYKGMVLYVGHKFGSNTMNKYSMVISNLYEADFIHDGICMIFAGHTHQQFLKREAGIIIANPGAIVDSWNHTRGFAIYDTETKEAVFSRLNSSESRLHPTTVGILSDTYNVDELDTGFWARCRYSFDKRNVTSVICCGNFLPQDIGRQELNGLEVYYYLQSDYSQPKLAPPNWHQILPENPVINLAGHTVYVQHGIKPEQLGMSVLERDEALKEIRSRYTHLDYIVAGLGPETVYQEFANYSFFNPGDARDGKYYGAILLPVRELTSGIVGT